MRLPLSASVRGRLRSSISRFSCDPTLLPGADFASIAQTGKRARHSCIGKLKGVMLGDPARRPKAVVIRTRRKPKGKKELFAVAAVALVAYLVYPGDTLSGIAASHGATLAAAPAANPHISDPNLINPGQAVEIPSGLVCRAGVGRPAKLLAGVAHPVQLLTTVAHSAAALAGVVHLAQLHGPGHRQPERSRRTERAFLQVVGLLV